MSGVGSWEWVGNDSVAALSSAYEVRVWSRQIPSCDLAIIVKYGFAEAMTARRSDVPVVFMPIDAYGSVADIDRDGSALSMCHRIVLHSPSLAHYFRSYASVEFLDHAVRYVSPMPASYRSDGPFVWIGMRTNLSPVVDWINRYGLPGPLLVLTNLESSEPRDSAQFGFSRRCDVQVERWSAARHRELAVVARAAIDIKGRDFRQKHKPAAKAVDFLASGLPLAMNPDSSSSAWLAEQGFRLAVPENIDHWLSREYWDETQRFGRVVRERLSSEQVGYHLRRIVEAVLLEQEQRP